MEQTTLKDDFKKLGKGILRHAVPSVFEKGLMGDSCIYDTGHNRSEFLAIVNTLKDLCNGAIALTKKLLPSVSVEKIASEYYSFTFGYFFDSYYNYHTDFFEFSNNLRLTTDGLKKLLSEYLRISYADCSDELLSNYLLNTDDWYNYIMNFDRNLLKYEYFQKIYKRILKDRLRYLACYKDHKPCVNDKPEINEKIEPEAPYYEEIHNEESYTEKATWDDLQYEVGNIVDYFESYVFGGYDENGNNFTYYEKYLSEEDAKLFKILTVSHIERSKMGYITC